MCQAVKGIECVYFILRPVAIFFVTITFLEYSAGGYTYGVPGGRVSCGYIGINW
jgi:hypothetical protein